MGVHGAIGRSSACPARIPVSRARSRHVPSGALTADVMAASPVIASNISRAEVCTNKLKTFMRTSALLLQTVNAAFSGKISDKRDGLNSLSTGVRGAGKVGGQLFETLGQC